MILGTRSDDPGDIVLCGMAMSRVLLLSTAHGIAHSYLNQPMMYAKLRAKVAALVEGVEDLTDPVEVEDAIRGIHPQVILRLGFGEPIDSPTPRNSLKSMLIKEPPLLAEP